MFCTAITCIDGRFIGILNQFIWENYHYTRIDTITEAGPIPMLLNPPSRKFAENLSRKLLVSVEKHQSNHLFLAAHINCAGDEQSPKYQIEDLKVAAKLMRGEFPEFHKITCLYIHSESEVQIVYDLP